MTWLLHFQWPAGFALILFGILTWAGHMEALLGQRLSTGSERLLPRNPGQVLLGMLAGACLQGQRGRHYCRRRYLAGLLPASGTTLFAIGMMGGIFLPAALILLAPAPTAFLLLLLGSTLQIASHPHDGRRLGGALLGLGICWIGYTACRQAALPDNLLPPALLAALGIALLACSPATALLIVVATQADPASQLPLLAGSTTLLALAWLGVLAWTLQHARRPFDPPVTLLQRIDLAYPERALQACLQEHRRMALGLGRAIHSLISGTQQKGPAAIAAQRQVRDIEHAMDEWKPAAQHYLQELACYRLQQRQARLVMFLFINIGDLERISDHLLAVARALPGPAQRAAYPTDLLQDLDAMLARTATILDILAQSMTGNRTRKQHYHGAVEQARDQALEDLDHFTARLQHQILHGALSTALAIRLQELRSHFERLIRHARAIAMAGEQEEFWIEPDVIHERAIKPPRPARARTSLTSTQKADLLRENLT